MRFFSASSVLTGLLLATIPAAAAVQTHHTASTHAALKHVTLRGHKATKTTTTHHAGMDSDRATQIQSALISRGYMTGAPSGTWDSQSISAMQKMQADNGWQTRLMPDSRALIKLGLGPQQTASASLPQ
jgi:hypothetical protein